MEFLLDFILHIDQHMIEIVQEYHTWAYAFRDKSFSLDIIRGGSIGRLL